jgi:hypothetical protein
MAIVMKSLCWDKNDSDNVGLGLNLWGGGRSVNQNRNVVARYGFVSFGCREVTRTTTHTSLLEDF